MRYLFMVSLLLLTVAVILFLMTKGCGETSTCDDGGTSSRYESEEFKNADPSVQEDIIISDILRKKGYSEQELKDAGIITTATDWPENTSP